MEGKMKARMNGNVPTSLGRPVGLMALDEPPPRMRRTIASSGRNKPVILRHDMGAGPTPPSRTQDRKGNKEITLEGSPECDIQFIDVPKTGQNLKNTTDPTFGRVLNTDVEGGQRGMGPTSKLVKRDSKGKIPGIDSGAPSGSRSGAPDSIIYRSGVPGGSSRSASNVSRKVGGLSNERTTASGISRNTVQSGVPRSGQRGVEGSSKSGVSANRSGNLGNRSGNLGQRSGIASTDTEKCGLPSSGRPSSGRKAASSGRRTGAPSSGTEKSRAPGSGTRRGSASSSGRSSALSSTRSGYSDALESEISQSTEFSEVPKQSRVIDPKEILEQNQEGDFEKIYEINLHAAELTAISNLEKFTKVRVLDLSCNFIEKIENLEPNSDLRELKLYDNRLRVVERLKGCKELSNLQLQHNKIRQIGKGLSGLSKLKHLRIDCNRLLKLEAAEVSCCSQLTTLDISFNILDNISALNYLPHLEDLLAAGNRLRSVDLSRCKRLQEADLSNNKLADISGLRGLPNLQIINLGSNQLTSLKGLGKSRSLQEIHAADNKFTELSYIPTNFPKLEILNITDSCIEDFDEVCYLEELSELAELFIAGNPFSEPGGSHTHYMAEMQVILPNLEILDGAHVKRTAQKGAPVMRPMSASTIISVRQVEAQIKSSDSEMKNLESSILKQFDSLREMYETLPERPLSPLTSENSLDGQRKTRSRARIQDAMKFAADNF
ncbi:187-kDa microtubule-associated protein AIR9-like [Mizuhopecten yessoensis]|nr:187-kDa microtubule-associated protein AIR9-like [Mizuhopecten yessoensis]XP_021353228.1 187-kDa microtubule-associated protein AIR9-like [Mizuhopecten yessoensis]XP_021353229.1 187-kDa microtubule-associated protein AIR9-like [Mizuhopecten yessoensis]XP_021353230.1 187-kDa microtubule-associated protein AIR9-like [Mizuhopecten yessoensis]XP_021353231.1 187-kDa microtubule-associated protein AIR9-like [Mizuhopecten yessoensis]XP_021353232.1 187-kDa microtubule-associated protein AIR9-like [